jgi:hypothetical protein
MRPGPLPVRHRGIPDSGLKARTAAVGPSNHHCSVDLTVWPVFGGPGGCRCTSGPTPTWRAIRLHAVGPLTRGHDVSGTGWQIVGRAMRSITTMVPT